MIKILLIGHDGSRNRGCEAILRSTISIIRRHIDNPVEFSVMSYDGASDLSVSINKLGKIRIIDIGVDFSRKFSLKRLINGLNKRIWPGFLTYKSFSNRSFLRNADIVISIGGDNFTDDYGSPSAYFRELAYAKSHKALTVIWGASIGPFLNRHLEKKWTQELKKVDLITVREPVSLKYLEQLGVADNVKLVADPAFLLKPDSNVSDHPSILNGDRIVGLGLSGIFYKYNSELLKFIESFTFFSRSMLSDKSTKLLLVPHVFGEDVTHNDYHVCDLLAKRLKDTDRVRILGPENNTSQIKHFISQCDYFIGARTHSTIASLSSYIPTLSIAYSNKAFGINKLIFDHIDYVLPISEVDEVTLTKKFDLLFSNRLEIISQLKKRLPAIKTMADNGGKYLSYLLKQHK